MTAATESAVQHGVRFHRPDGTRVCYLLADDTAGVVELMDDLAAEGITRMEPVRRPMPDWEINPAGLPAAVRHLAEAHVDKQVDHDIVRDRLHAWLAADGELPISVIDAWGRLFGAIEAHRAAEDGPLGEDQDREQLVAAAEGRIAAAVREICGGTA